VLLGFLMYIKHNKHTNPQENGFFALNFLKVLSSAMVLYFSAQSCRGLAHSRPLHVSVTGGLVTLLESQVGSLNPLGLCRLLILAMNYDCLHQGDFVVRAFALISTELLQPSRPSFSLWCCM
jgi:hypothetical protein